MFSQRTCIDIVVGASRAITTVKEPGLFGFRILEECRCDFVGATIEITTQIGWLLPIRVLISTSSQPDITRAGRATTAGRARTVEVKNVLIGGQERQRFDVGSIDRRSHILRRSPRGVDRFACGNPEVVCSQASGTIRREIHRQFIPGKNRIVVVVSRVYWWPDIDGRR